ncbi:MAG: sugar ABC transporter substrate-binding protein [Ardenticatenaceae bacterium]|nr:sugar ABC transporter substrate-binding protein [Ardenticatenaceae bacterium]
MKKYYLTLLFVFLTLPAGCTNANLAPPSPPASEADSSATAPTIALVMKTLTNPFFVEMEKGARQAEAELGIHLIVKTAAQETSIEQQIEIVDELIRQQVDAIVIAPGDSLKLIPVLKKAQDAGIVVINIDNRLDRDYSQSLGLENVPFISVNNQQGAYLSAKYISDMIDTPTKAIIIEGIRDAQNAEDRKAGAIQAFNENTNITLVATETANWKIDESYEVTLNLFAANPDIGAIFCANDMMALGALKYLEESGKSDVLVAAFDALEEAKQAIREGNLAVSIDQQAAQQGYLGIQYAVKALAGESLPPETFVDVLVVNADNVD